MQNNTVHYKGGQGLLNYFPAFRYNRWWVRLGMKSSLKEVWECEVKDIFRQQAQQQVVPHILQPTDCSNEKFTVYSRKLLSSSSAPNLRWDTHDLCLLLMSRRPERKCGSLINGRLQQDADLAFFWSFWVYVNGVNTVFWVYVVVSGWGILAHRWPMSGEHMHGLI